MYVYDEKIGRRKFLKVSAGAAALVGATNLTGCGSANASESQIAANAEGEKKWGREAGKWIPSCCNMCGGQSGILCHVVDGVVTGIEPNSWNPNNYSNISSDFFNGYTEEYGTKDCGALCARGNAGIAQLYDPDRVKKPLKRSNPDKSPGADPKWVEISIEQAVDEIASKMKTLRDKDEAHKLLWISEDHSFTHIQGDFLKLYGSPNYGMHSNLCDVSRKASFKCVMGHDRPLADFKHAKYILLFGWNPLSSIKWVYLPRIVTEGMANGAKLTVVDPYMSHTAAKATEWVSIRPGTDGALALALANVIIREELYDKEFVSKWSVGFEEYAEYVKTKTPEWAEEITSISARTIERIAKELATSGPAIIDTWSGPGQHSNAVQGGRAIACLAALVNGFDRPGTMIVPNKGGNSHQHVYPDEKADAMLKNPRFDELDKFPLGHGSGVYTRYFENILKGDHPYEAKMMMCVFQNPVMSVPASDLVQKAIAKLETFVVVDTMMSETALLADYVIPGTTYFERYDFNTHWVTWPVLGLRQPVVDPLFGQPTEYEFVTMLGRKLGLKEASGNDFFNVGPLSGQRIESLKEWYEDYLSKEIKNGKPGITLAELKELPGAVWVDKKGTEYEKYMKTVADSAIANAWFDGDPAADGTNVYDKPKAEGGKLIGVVVDGKPRVGFGTKSKKVEFVSSWLADKVDANGNRIDSLPVYSPREWQPTEEYPLYFINWKESSHTHSRTQNNALLLEIKPDNPLILHPETAAKYGVKEGSLVEVESKYGKFRQKVSLSKRMHREVIGLQHGFGHIAFGKTAKGRGASDSVLRPLKSDPLSGMALHKEACVKIRRV
ncbi:MAG: molybdopterin-dependent oxidoreductase [Planctomycetes bacterium]|nr:molybdopterin-dependent oxidoreductase [Planctomycetota bacterium]